MLEQLEAAVTVERLRTAVRAVAVETDRGVGPRPFGDVAAREFETPSEHKTIAASMSSTAMPTLSGETVV